MNKTLAITAIALVAVVMGMSAIAPMIQYAEARHGETISEKACDAARKSPVPLPPAWSDHCPSVVPPPGN